MTLLLPYLLLFFRMVIGFVFASSFLGKLKDVSAFERTITRFALLPRQLSRPTAWLLLSFELAVTVLMLLEGIWLAIGLLLAAGLLFIFALALASVTARKIQTPCNCFGSGTRPISPYDIWRNVCFIACALAGWSVLANMGEAHTLPDLWSVGLLALVAASFVGVTTQIGEIIQFFQQS